MKIYAEEIEKVKLPDYPNKFEFAGSSLGDIVSQILNYAIVLAGIAFFGFLIMGGFDLLTSAGNPEGIKRGTNKIIYGLTGFIIVMASYFILQVVELVFGITITG